MRTERALELVVVRAEADEAAALGQRDGRGGVLMRGRAVPKLSI